MSDGGRTFWWAKDAGWWRRERIVELGEEFGPAGPAVIDWLACEAKLQNAAGRVKSGPRSVARGCFVPVDVVGHVLSRAVTLNLLDDFEESDGRFTCRISGWQADQERGRASERQAAARERRRSETAANDHDPAAEPPVTHHAASRPVTPRHAESPTEQNRTKKETPPDPPMGGTTEEPMPARPVGVIRARDLDRWEADVAAWAQRHFPDADARSIVGAARYVSPRVDEPLTPARLLEFCRAAADAGVPQWLSIVEPASAAA